MKNEFFKEILLENTLYTNDVEKAEFLSDDSNIMNAFAYNFIGILGAYESSQIILFNRSNTSTTTSDARKMVRDIRTYVKQDQKLRIDSISDENNNMSLILKIMSDKDMFINKSRVNEMTRFLVKFKAGGIDRVSEEIIRNWISNIKPAALRNIDMKIRGPINDFIKGDLNIIELSKTLRKHYKKFSAIVGDDFWKAAKYVNFKSVDANAIMNPVVDPNAKPPKAPKQTKSVVDPVTQVVDPVTADVVTQPNVDDVIDALNQLLPDVVDAPTLTPHELNMKAIEDNAETITRMILSQESYDNISGYFETLLIDDDNSSVIRAVIIKYYQYLIFGEDDFSNTPQLSQLNVGVGYEELYNTLKTAYIKLAPTIPEYATFLSQSRKILVRTPPFLGKPGFLDWFMVETIETNNFLVNFRLMTIALDNNAISPQVAKDIKPYFVKYRTNLGLHFEFPRRINDLSITEDYFVSILLNEMFEAKEAFESGKIMEYSTTESNIDTFINGEYIAQGIYSYIVKEINDEKFSIDEKYKFASIMEQLASYNVGGNIQRLIDLYNARENYKLTNSLDDIVEYIGDYNANYVSKDLKELKEIGVNPLDVLKAYEVASANAGIRSQQGFYATIEGIFEDPKLKEEYINLVLDGDLTNRVYSARYIENKDISGDILISFFERTGDLSTLGISTSGYNYSTLPEFFRYFDVAANPSVTKRFIKKNLELGNPIFSKEQIKGIYRRADKDSLLSDLFSMCYDLKDSEPDLCNQFFDSIDPYYQAKIRNRSIGVDAVIDEIKNSDIKLFDEVDAKRIKKIFEYNGLSSDEIAKGYGIRKKKGQSFTSYIAEVDKVISTTESTLEKLKVSDGTEDSTIVVSSTKRLVKNYYAGNHGNFFPIVRKEFNASLKFEEFEKFKEFVKERYGSIDQIVPAFHGTGGIAASMIMRYGFTVIPSTDKAAVGRMLGNGIYFSNKIDKVAQYASNSGYARRYGTRGYIFEMEATLGKAGIDYRAAGLGGDNIRSPEWAVKNPKDQLNVVKVYEIEIVPYDQYKKYVGESVNESFNQYITEAKKENSMKKYEIFIFNDDLVPTPREQGGYEIIDSSKLDINHRVEIFNGKTTIYIESNKQSINEYIARRMTSKELKYFLKKAF